MMLIYEWTLSRQYLFNLHWQRFAFQTVGKIYKIRSKGCLSKQITFKERLGKQLCPIKLMCKTKTRKSQQSEIWNCSKNYCENKKGLEIRLVYRSSPALFNKKTEKIVNPQTDMPCVVYWEHSTCSNASNITVGLLNDVKLLNSSNMIVPAY